MISPSNIDPIVRDILADMPLKEKAIIGNLDEDKVPCLQYAFDVCIRGQLGKDDEMGKDVMHRIWGGISGDTSVAVCFAFLFAPKFIGHLTINE